MRLISIRIQNYKGYRDSGRIAFGNDFNLIMGQNNSGKTSLLEALSFRTFSAKPHKNAALSRDIPLLPNSKCDVEFEISGPEMRSILLRNGASFRFPFNKDFRNEHEALDILEDLMTSPVTIVKAQCVSGNWGIITTPSHGFFGDNGSPQTGGAFLTSEDRQRFLFAGSCNYAEENTGAVVAQCVTGEGGVYVFRAERLNIGSCQIGDDPVLAPDAANLPSVLLLLQGRNPNRFDRLVSYLRAIFPSIYTVRAHQRGGNSAEINVWQVDPQTERDDLAVSLADSGTGVGQVIAILYVAVNSNTPRTIVIDEPNSFLHPGAARKLIEILKSEPLNQHQYIVATHSPEILGVAEPTTLHVTEWTGEETSVRALDVSEVADTRYALREVGARLSDVFGSDAILWVEGPTEEECFPKILKRFGVQVPLGTKIVAVRSTDEIARADGEIVWDVYRRISSASAMLPATIAFSFDREARTQTKRDDLIRASSRKINFLPYRTFENYLLSEEAILSVLNTTPTFAATPLTVEALHGWLEAHGAETSYFRPLTAVPVNSPEWISKVDAPRLLEKLFDNISEGRERYQKTKHSVRITEWLLQNKPEVLQPVADYLSEILKLPAGDS